MWRMVWSMAILGLASAACAEQGRDSYMKHYTVESSFENVKENIELAVTGRGMVINNVSHIGNMLERTGKDIGAGQTLYTKAEALEFCSASVSRRMMEADPHNVVFCPYIIAIYVLPQQPEVVHVAYRRPQLVGTDESKASLQAVETLLDEIIDEAIQ